jgi:hypothetical protein
MLAHDEREMIAQRTRMHCKPPRLAVSCSAILGLLMFAVAPSPI